MVVMKKNEAYIIIISLTDVPIVVKFNSISTNFLEMFGFQVVVTELYAQFWPKFSHTWEQSVPPDLIILVTKNLGPL